MDSPLWTETHAPAVDDLPQEDVRRYLDRASEEPINLLLQGPRGCGKTAAARALAASAHEHPDTDLVEINVADFFGRTKAEIASDPRFEPFLAGKSGLTKRDMINHVLTESASYPPVSGSYKTILLDNAEAAREDFQHALRRIMERHHRSTQFVIATRQPSSLVSPIRSRCFPVPVRAPTSAETAAILEGIVETEDVEYDRAGVEFVAGYAKGNLRRAILSAQTTVAESGSLTQSAAFETLGSVGIEDTINELLDDAEAGAFTDARSTLDDLLVDEGLDGAEVLEAILAVARSRYQGLDVARMHQLVGEIDVGLQEGATDRIQVGQLLAELGRDTR